MLTPRLSTLAAAPYDPPVPDRRTRQIMLDRLRHTIQTRVDELPSEAEKLRRACP